LPGLLAEKDAKPLAPLAEALLDDLLEPRLEAAPRGRGQDRDVVAPAARALGDARGEPEERIVLRSRTPRSRVERRRHARQLLYPPKHRFECTRRGRRGGERERGGKQEHARGRCAHAPWSAAASVELNRHPAGTARLGEAVEVRSG